ncbi:MAG: L,D-transpeptidase [Polyangiaceae bacterium]|nr:L,D-transpeptidase [Polyangiaceae bacterium]
MRVPPATAIALLTTSLLGQGCRTDELATERDRARSAAKTAQSLGRSTGQSRRDAAAIPNEATPDVALGSEARSDAALASDSKPRVYALSRHVWIWPEPDASLQWIGFLWFGGSVELKSTEPVAGAGCDRFYAIEPRGYVCVDGRRATLEANHPVLVAIRPYAPKVDTPWPHRYGESRGLKRYAELPADKPERHSGPERAKQGGSVDPLLADAGVASAEPSLQLPTLPRGLREDRAELGARSTVAYSTETLLQGRTWLLSADLMWMPEDRVTPYPEVTFRGVHLDKDTHLPLAFFRGKDRPKYRRASDGSLEPTELVIARLSWVALTGRSLQDQGDRFLEVSDGSYVRAKDAVVPELRKRTPWGAAVGEQDDTGLAPRGRGTWIDVSVWGGWLLAYEGTRPVFATLVSPGRGGTPQEGKEPIETAATPTGRFNITGKFKTATMVAPGELIHSDVPWAQNFTGPYALHGAYWHNDWGQLKSGGCVNVSPIDGKWLFEWTEPTAPPGWHGVRWLPRLEPATTFIVHR